MELNAKMSEVDLAYGILYNSGKPLYYKELIEKILDIRPVEGKDVGHIMAAVHTEINLDYRFVHLGKGIWGLKEWSKGYEKPDYDDDCELDEE